MAQLDINALLSELGPVALGWGLDILGAIVLLVVGRWIAGRLRSLTRRTAERARLDPTLSGFVGMGVYWLVLVFVIVAILGVFGIPTASMVAILGAAGLAVGLAFQGTLSNFASGVMLLIFRPISVGDFVEVGGSKGTVRSIGIFSTAMDTPDNVRVVVPNSGIFGETIQNYSVNENRRIDLVVGVGYDDDLQLAKDTILRVLKEEARVLAEPEPVVAVSEMAGSSVNFVVRPWVEAPDYWAARWDLTRALKEELEAAGLSIPYPQRDLHLFSGGAALRIPARG
ncbi:MAG: mechanosensitive ion channel [Gemmatimonadetes bacterium]|nr:mechanosensitive ion channel [Gemmatimonadota bacterium]NIR81290.1 mechanosensitive ion channel [Gemmatimonadota bacterium]NIT90125.1 mechanosensitive ion channel [Gemmatimonadota bacterium]NIU33952.1 mechanosensitive ion channel [Gemmatimonadota bacterium]NIU38131.1 mechanosensitive ion channel [Gemmatimonadota bacterium]